MKNRLFIFCIFTLAVTAIALRVKSENADDETVHDVATTIIINDKIVDLEFDIIKNEAKTNTDKNFTVSPLCAQIFLSMTANLMNDEKAKRISDMLGYKNLNELNSDSKNILSIIRDDRETESDEDADEWESPKTIIANSLWASKNVKIPSKIKKTLEYNYRAQSYKIDFNSAKAADMINNWCIAQTDSLITSAVNEIPAETEAMMITCMNFEGQWHWSYHFSEPEPDIFHSPTGDKTAMMMQVEIEADYAKTDSLETLLLKLDNGYQLICMLPDKGIKLDDVFNSLNKNTFNKAVEQCSKRDIILSLPAFKIDSQIDFVKLLKHVNINLDDQSLYSIKLNKSGYLSSQQKASIMVDEYGVTASAITNITICLGCKEQEDPITLKFDRPFIFILKDPQTNEIIMAGQFVNP